MISVKKSNKINRIFRLTVPLVIEEHLFMLFFFLMFTLLYACPHARVTKIAQNVYLMILLDFDKSSEHNFVSVQQLIRVFLYLFVKNNNFAFF